MSLTITPYKYQDDGIEWMYNRETDTEEFMETPPVYGGILADEVGLGKTIQSIGIICKNPKPRTLIFVPKSLVNQWVTEFEKFASGLNVKVFTGHEDTTFDDTSVPCVLIASVSRSFKRNDDDFRVPELHGVHWNRVIIDEAHSIKNKKSKLHKAVSCLKTDIKWCLTATPVMNTMKDFIYIMGYIGVCQMFCQNYKDKVTDKYILRRTKEQVKVYNSQLELPPLTKIVYKVPFETQEEDAIYNQVFQNMAKQLRKIQGRGNNAIEALEKLLRVRQVCIHPQLYYDGMSKKFKEFMGEFKETSTKEKHIVKLLKEKPKQEKALVFCQFIKEMDIFQKAIQEAGFNTTRIDGSMSLEQRSDNVELFKTNPDVTVFLIQINTGGQGYNLQDANWVYITSPTWNPAIEYQAIGRSHRTGQKKQVNVIQMIISTEHGTIEENIMDLQHKKRKIVADILKDPTIEEAAKEHEAKKARENLSVQDIMNLFRKRKVASEK